MHDKEQITTRTYKIKAIVIGILAVMVYIASQYVMFCNLPILESTGERVETVGNKYKHRLYCSWNHPYAYPI